MVPRYIYGCGQRYMFIFGLLKAVSSQKGEYPYCSLRLGGTGTCLDEMIDVGLLILEVKRKESDWLFGRSDSLSE